MRAKYKKTSACTVHTEATVLRLGRNAETAHHERSRHAGFAVQCSVG
jgi:hypothetical protein